MQNRYVADIGDFGKYGLLSFISDEAKLKLGVNWYLTETSSKEFMKNKGDGKLIGYLLNSTKYGSKSNKSEGYVAALKKCDETLYKKLQGIIIMWLDNDEDPKFRCVQLIEDNEILPTGTLFYPEVLTEKNREEWHHKGIRCLSKCKLVFFDPDIDIRKTNATGIIQELAFLNMYGENCLLHYICGIL